MNILSRLPSVLCIAGIIQYYFSIQMSLFCISNSIEKVPKITSQVLVIHGTEDEVVDFSHGLAIHERCPRKVEPLWVEGAGHNDIELYGQYLDRLKQFINVELSPSPPPPPQILQQ